MKAIIVGAGIGGLTLALMLHKRGIHCDVFESVRELKPLGVGINLLPHAAAEMQELDMLDTLEANSVTTSALHYYNRFGQNIWQEARGLAAGYPVPQLSIHRGRLQLLLAEAVRQRLGAEHLHTGMAFESMKQDADGITALFRDRSGDADLQEVRGDVLIGADGIHSAVRKGFYPERDEFRFSGRILWRAVTYTQPYLDGRTMFMAGHQDQKFVAYPILDDAPEGTTAINWIAELSVPAGERSSTDWNRVVDKSVFAAEFQNWNWPWIDIPALIDGAQAIYEFPLVDKDPLPRWTHGKATLVGDAAHPLYPIGSNGSAQAILDARCLADRLSETVEKRHRNIEAALKEYEAQRLPATTGIILRNRLNGPEQVMQLAHERAPDGFAHIHDVMPQQELEEISMRYKRAAGFVPTAPKAA